MAFGSGSRIVTSHGYSTPKQVAERLGVSLNTVYALAQRGEIPVAFRIGPRLRLDMAAVERTLKAREEGSAD